MLAELDELKQVLGILPTDVDAVRDAKLSSALLMANSLIAGYVGLDLSDTSTEYPFTTVLDNHASYVKLPLYPVLEVVSVSDEGVTLAPTAYQVRERTGMIDFIGGASCGVRYGRRVSVVYRAGFDEVPQDLKTVALNMASTIYDMGGTFSTASAGGTGALKSLTMFDAMSMSFDTGAAATSTANTPEGMVKTWAFILNKYRVDSPVLA